MASFSEELGFDEGQLRERCLSLVAYARSNRRLRLPVAPEGQERVPLPAVVGDEVLAAEAATAIAGAAGAALVVDQRIGLRLCMEAANYYSIAGYPFAAFVGASLSGSVRSEWGEWATRIAEAGIADPNVPTAVLEPSQLAYLALGMVLAGEPGVGGRMMHYMAGAGGLGAFDVPLSLVRAAVETGHERGTTAWQQLARHVLLSFERSRRARFDRPLYRQMMAWEVGLPVDAALLVFDAVPSSAGDESPISGQYASGLWSVAREMRVEAASVLELADQPLELVLAEWLDRWRE